ncbi:MAG: VOC family protein [Novosphingobium sp.]
MQVNGLNHVNIVAADIDATVRFYETLLGMPAEPTPNMPAGYAGRWIRDANAQPVIHLQAHNPERHGPRADPLPPTGSIDHVSLTCEGFAAMLERCEELGVPYRVNDRQFEGLRQVFITDPNNVQLELNFTGD